MSKEKQNKSLSVVFPAIQLKKSHEIGFFSQAGGAAVMVWIHGGGFNSGSAVQATFFGQPLVALGDVIVVTINYRLNIFGFLTTGAPYNLMITSKTITHFFS